MFLTVSFNKVSLLNEQKERTSMTSASALTNWLTPAKWGWSFAVACVAVLLASIAISTSYLSHTAIEPDEVNRVSKCRDALVAQVRAPGSNLDVSQFSQAHALCYTEVNEEDMLVDYSIRKSAYLNQQKQTTVLLWMVVAITLSGVILAGVQLIAGYRLASAGKAAFDAGGTIDIEKGKLSLKSSVTGLVILAISLVFFFVFVKEVYLIREQGVVGHPPVNSMAPSNVAEAKASANSANSPQFVRAGVGAPLTTPAPSSNAPTTQQLSEPLGK
jgi:hypothetical protein